MLTPVSHTWKIGVDRSNGTLVQLGQKIHPRGQLDVSSASWGLRRDVVNTSTMLGSIVAAGAYAHYKSYVTKTYVVD